MAAASTDLPMTAALRILAFTKMSRFTETDWTIFSGCESEDPLIGYIDNFCVVLDGEDLVLINKEDADDNHVFHLAEM